MGSTEMCGINGKRPMAALGSVVTVSSERSTFIGLTARNGIVEDPQNGLASLGLLVLVKIYSWHKIEVENFKLFKTLSLILYWKCRQFRAGRIYFCRGGSL
jgi:hypothetical protein